ncbi:MAG: DUF4870 domain-containing protein [Gemmatales bacterium]|nr:DUF4870 domain-containing protein [Gemmatales bacterium]MDW8388027.1 DUF4870 domain-containing protein [Gemmatales bacterium]
MSSEFPSSEEPPVAEPAASSPSEPVPVTQEERTWGLFAHLSGLLATFVTAGFGFLGPLIIWLAKKDTSKFVDYHGKEALNFQLNMLILSVIAVAATIITCGFAFPLPMAVVVINCVFSIIAALKANEGKLYEYPYIVRMVK